MVKNAGIIIVLLLGVLVLSLSGFAATDAVITKEVPAARIAPVTVRGMPQKARINPPVKARPVSLTNLRPLVTSSNPSALRLAAGGQVTTVILSGTDLNLISGAQMKQGNLASNQVTVKLVGVATATAAKLEIQALANAATGPYVLALLQGGKALPVPAGTLRVMVLPEQVAMISTPNPASFMPGALPAAGNSGSPQLQTGNAGGQGAGSGGGGPSPTSPTSGPSAVAAQRAALSGNPPQLLVPGSLENLDHKIALVLPDLVLMDLGQENGVLQARLKVFNTPPGQNFSANLKFDIYHAGQLTGRTQGEVISFVGSTSQWVNLVMPNVSPGWTTFKVHVNPDIAFLETNYANNVMEEAISFENIAPAGLPDFFVDKVYVGQDKKVYVKIGNQGVDYSGMLTTSSEQVIEKVPGKMAGRNVTIKRDGFLDIPIDVSHQYTVVSTEVRYQLNITINPEGPLRTKEGSYSNNSGTLDIKAAELFSLEDISISKVFYKEQGIVLGETQFISVEMQKEYTLIVDVKNNGVGSSHDGKIIIERFCGAGYGRNPERLHFTPGVTKQKTFIKAPNSEAKTKKVPCEIELIYLGPPETKFEIFHYYEMGY